MDLEKEDERLLICGLINFLVSALRSCFAQGLPAQHPHPTCRWRTYRHLRLYRNGLRHYLAMAVPFATSSLALLYVLLPRLEPVLQAAVPVYALIISVMCYAAAVRVGVDRGAYLPVAAGAVFFMASDTVLALG